MAENAVALVDKESSFIPFGGKDEIKLSINIVKRLVAVKTKEGQTCSDDDAIKFIMMCKARLLNPFEGDAFLIGYDTRDGAKYSLITAHQAFLKRAEMHKEYDGMESGVIVMNKDGSMTDLPGDFHAPEQKPIGGWATVFFKNRSHPMHKRVRLARFQKSFGVWQDDPAGMIVKCAEADALRSSFPTMLGGLYVKEETEPSIEAPTTKPIFTSPEPEEDIKDVEEVEPKAPPAGAVPPTVAVPAARSTKTASKAPRPAEEAVEPAKAPPAVKYEPKTLSVLEVTRQRMKTAGITDEQIMKFLIGANQVDPEATTLEEVSINEPQALDLLYTNFDDIAERIKSVK